MRFSNAFSKTSSKILLGTAYFGDTIPESEAFQIMDKYAECGGTHIDTARLYAGGMSEVIVGKWLKLRRHSDVFVSTKGAFPSPNAPQIPRVSEKDIRFDLEQSLKALDVDCINFYWLHRDDENVECEQIIELMNTLVKEGKILHFGASNWSVNRVKRANDYAKVHNLLGFEASQIRFSPAIIAPNGSADRTLVDMTKEAFNYYREQQIPVAAYASQAKGFFSKMASVGENGLSTKSKERYLCPENLEKLEQMKALAVKYNCSIAAIVCASLCSLTIPDVFPIIGGSKISQIQDSISGADIVLTKEELNLIFDFDII